ncbi:MAG TPA: (d)CMP kinase [Candidatus Saccharimonadales bacterium]|nr:(d)CMP kinase [Candidatus Saccharimonadales bacterium]
MRTASSKSPNVVDYPTCIVTAGGWARSGKGTSMAHLKGRIEQRGYGVRLIDQGLKFRAMGEVVLNAGQELDSPTSLEAFIRLPETQRATLAVLGDLSSMTEEEIKARLRTPQISKVSAKVAKVPSAHEVTSGLLRTEVSEAVEAKSDVVIIDGRSMEGHARRFENEGLAKFVLGWYFKCDTAIAARRSLGLFAAYEDLTHDEKLQLLAETLNISDRNRSDTLRDTDPLREPARAYRLDLSTYGAPGTDVPYKMGFDMIHRGMAIVDTSYTSSIEEMTGPVSDMSMWALRFKGPLTQFDIGPQAI